MKTYWIIGGGKFGLKAAQTIRAQEPTSKIVIVEKKLRFCKDLQKQGFETVFAEGITYLERNLVNADFPDWIIPAIPLHVAFEWIQRKVSNKQDIEIIALPAQLEAQLPNPISGRIGQLYVSNADFTCPDDCPEPDEICTYTGKPRPRVLNSFLEKLNFEDFKSIVVCSQQLFPGVGGYSPKALFDAFVEIECERRPVVLSTACRCHGVLNLFRIISRK